MRVLTKMVFEVIKGQTFKMNPGQVFQFQFISINYLKKIISSIEDTNPDWAFTKMNKKGDNSGHSGFYPLGGGVPPMKWQWQTTIKFKEKTRWLKK